MILTLPPNIISYSAVFFTPFGKVIVPSNAILEKAARFNPIKSLGKIMVLIVWFPSNEVRGKELSVLLFILVTEASDKSKFVNLGIPFRKAISSGPIKTLSGVITFKSVIPAISSSEYLAFRADSSPEIVGTSISICCAKTVMPQHNSKSIKRNLSVIFKSFMVYLLVKIIS